MIKEDIVGNKYNHLYVKAFIERKNKSNYYLVECDCGKEVVLPSRAFKYGKYKTCGCKMNAKTNKIDLTGQRFGRLVVLREAGRQHGEILWECQCGCGNICYVTGYNLRSGHTKSCGCYCSDRTIEENRKPIKFDIENYPWGVGWTSNTGEIFIFDKEDYEKIKDYCWSIDAYGYVVTRINGKTTKLHRIIMQVANPDIFVDHIRHDKRDNRKERLRLVTNQQNTKNRIPKNKSGVSGVNYDESRKVWVANITHNYQNIYLGSFQTEEEAIHARRQADQKYSGEYSYENSMKGNIGDAN